MKKKILALCLVVVLVATAITGVTLAYFTDKTDVAKNTFTVGDVDIKLDETNTDGEEGDPDRDTENKYENVYPGQTVVKDPMVTFEADSRDCYVRMIVTLGEEEIAALKTAFPTPKYADYWKDDLFLLEKLVDWNSDAWVINEAKTKVGYYEFWYYGEHAEDEDGMIPADYAKKDAPLEPLFEHVTFPANMTNDEIGALNNFEVDIVAHAMQAEGFDSQAAAWAKWAE